MVEAMMMMDKMNTQSTQRAHTITPCTHGNGGEIWRKARAETKTQIIQIFCVCFVEKNEPNTQKLH